MRCIPALRRETWSPGRPAPRPALVLPLVLVLLAWSGGGVPAAPPQPSPVPERWQLDVEVGRLRASTVMTRDGPRAFYYLTYRVTNNSGQDLLFAPLWELATEEGTLIRSGLDVPREVTRELLSRFDNPLLLDQLSMLGRLLQGRENAREGLVIWPAEDLDVDEIRIFAAGFSGEFRSYLVPKPSGAPGQAERFVLRKTLSLRYCPAGELRPLQNQVLPRCDRPVWIMR